MISVSRELCGINVVVYCVKTLHNRTRHCCYGLPQVQKIPAFTTILEVDMGHERRCLSIGDLSAQKCLRFRQEAFGHSLTHRGNEDEEELHVVELYQSLSAKVGRFISHIKRNYLLEPLVMTVLDYFEE